MHRNQICRIYLCNFTFTCFQIYFMFFWIYREDYTNVTPSYQWTCSCASGEHLYLSATFCLHLLSFRSPAAEALTLVVWQNVPSRSRFYLNVANGKSNDRDFYGLDSGTCSFPIWLHQSKSHWGYRPNITVWPYPRLEKSALLIWSVK